MALALIGMALVAGCASAPPPCPEWPLWRAYEERFVADDGRVIDHFAQHTTSEGQAYGMFHALVARDRVRFERIVSWTTIELAQGDLGAHLPAWRWGRRADGSMGVLDAHAASDADLFMAYALVHAGITWGENRWVVLGGRLLGRVAAEEIDSLPGLGPMLMPGPHGFDTTAHFWRVNPSYQPVPLLRWAARIDPKGPWGAVLDASVRLAEEATPERFYPDWAAWNDLALRFVRDPIEGGRGSYDAIRAYLWPALMAPEDPLRGRLLARGSRLVEVARITGFVPEKVDAFDATLNGVPTAGPVGFQAVGQVFAQALGDGALAEQLAQRVAGDKKDGGLYGEPAFYYDHNLLLFAQGFIEGRFRFRPDGGLELGEAGCAGR